MASFMNEFEHLRIRLEEIKKATNNFGNKVIGSGGFGAVYEGQVLLSTGRSIVAIKRLNRQFGQGDPEFLKEIMFLSRYRHPNLISLLGFCDEEHEKVLIYEYAPKGSLDRYLNDPSLTWTQRIKICLGAAKGLSYLHDPRGTHQRVLHCDIKSANILLDENMTAKVADFGLSKMGPANQQHSIIFTNPVVGTPGYCDPLYVERYALTKESDVYSFGVVLFEVLCGRLCCQYGNGQPVKIFVRMWKQSYTENKLDEIIFQHHLMPGMHPTSLELFSSVAFQCLDDSRQGRPTMSIVVEKLESALRVQEKYDLKRLPEGYMKVYNEIIRAAVPPLIYTSEEELKELLFKGTLLNGGKTWFSLNMKGEHCELISIAECLTRTASESSIYVHEHDSRFAAGSYKPKVREFRTHVKTEFLSPGITYTVNLVLKNKDPDEGYIGLEYKLEGGRSKCYSFLSDEREDGWLTAELFQFTSENRNVDLKVVFYIKHCPNILVEGIEFRPLENVENDQVLNNELRGDLQPITDGKKCLTLSARATLRDHDWSWKSLPGQTRFEVAHDPSESFDIICQIESRLLSPQTTYAGYLVYKQESNNNMVQPPPGRVKNKNSGSREICYIYLSSPQTPVIITGTVNHTQYCPMNRPRIKGLPQQRSDGWMEVQIWEFCTTTKTIDMHLKLSSYDKTFEGIEVQGIELRPK